MFRRVTLTGFAFDVELLVLAQRWGLRIERIPVSLTHSHDSTVRLVRDSCQMLWDLLKINRRRARGLYERAETRSGEEG
jgi:dolichyl-phosphate beta-glucosyltransferase